MGHCPTGWKKNLETNYDVQMWKGVRGAFDYEFLTDPAYNRDRSPASILGARLHWDF
jgi:high affinity Mn2+ porin